MPGLLARLFVDDNDVDVDDEQQRVQLKKCFLWLVVLHLSDKKDKTVRERKKNFQSNH